MNAIDELQESLIQDQIDPAEMGHLDEILEQVVHGRIDAYELLVRATELAARESSSAFGVQKLNVEIIDRRSAHAREMWSSEGQISLGELALRDILLDSVALADWFVRLVISNYCSLLGNIPALETLFPLASFPQLALFHEAYDAAHVLERTDDERLATAFRVMRNIVTRQPLDLRDHAGLERDPITALAPGADHPWTQTLLDTAGSLVRGPHVRRLSNRLFVAALTFVVTHEHSHDFLGHHSGPEHDRRPAQQLEYEADVLAVRTLVDAERFFDVYAGVQVFRSMHRKRPHDDEQSTHPSSRDRLAETARAVVDEVDSWAVQWLMDQLRCDLDIELSRKVNTDPNLPWGEASLSTAVISRGCEIQVRLENLRSDDPAKTLALGGEIAISAFLWCELCQEDVVVRDAWVAVPELRVRASSVGAASTLHLFKGVVSTPPTWRLDFPDAELRVVWGVLPDGDLAIPVGSLPANASAQLPSHESSPGIVDQSPFERLFEESTALHTDTAVLWKAPVGELVPSDLVERLLGQPWRSNSASEILEAIRWLVAEDAADYESALACVDYLVAHDSSLLTSEIVGLGLDMCWHSGDAERAMSLLERYIAETGAPEPGLFVRLAAVLERGDHLLRALEFCSMELWAFGSVVSWREQAESLSGEIIRNSLRAVDAADAGLQIGRRESELPMPPPVLDSHSILHRFLSIGGRPELLGDPEAHYQTGQFDTEADRYRVTEARRVAALQAFYTQHVSARDAVTKWGARRQLERCLQILAEPPLGMSTLGLLQLRAEVAADLTRLKGDGDSGALATAAFAEVRELAPWFLPGYVQAANLAADIGRPTDAAALLEEAANMGLFHEQLIEANARILGGASTLPWELKLDNPHFVGEYDSGMYKWSVVPEMDRRRNKETQTDG